MVICDFELKTFIWRSWKNVFEAWELFWSSLRSLRTFECHCVLLCTTLLRRRVTSCQTCMVWLKSELWKRAATPLSCFHMVAEPQWSWGWGADAKRGCCDLWKIDTGLLRRFRRDLKRSDLVKMSGPAPMSPSTSPDSTVNPGGSASAPAGMVSGNGGPSEHRNDPCVQYGRATGPTSGVWTWSEFKFRSIASIWRMGSDPLQGPGDPCATTTPWISFSPGTSPAVLSGSHSSGSTGTWQTGNSGQSGTSAATFGMPPGFLDSGFSGHGGQHRHPPLSQQ